MYVCMGVNAVIILSQTVDDITPRRAGAGGSNRGLGYGGGVVGGWVGHPTSKSSSELVCAFISDAMNHASILGSFHEALRGGAPTEVSTESFG